tara:strand:+ start:253 stop:948 length:696 start_codon:yes stop_codon:yes gene_type:complete
MSYQNQGCVHNTEEDKYCARCKEVKPRTEYYKNKRRHDGLGVYCKPCEKEKRQQRLKTPEGKKVHYDYLRKWREENKEKSNEYARNWRENNAETIKQRRTSEEGRRYNREYNRMRRQDPVFRVRNNVSRQVSHALFREEGSKHGESVMKHLPYSPNQLKEHLEEQFDENMNWDNYGSYWHIDHIYPHSKLPYDSMDHPNFGKAWALDNLQPLEAGENISKSNRIIKDKKCP